MSSKCSLINRINLVSVLVLYLIINSVSPKSVPVKNVCSKADCKMAAKEISLKMDKNLQPCDNFYRFVCGNYMKDHSPTRAQLDLFEEMKNNSRTMFISLLENNNQKKQIKPLRHISKLYKLCTDQSTLIKQGAQPLREILTELGGWPVLEGDKWSEKNTNWMTITGNLVKLGLPSDLFIKFSIMNDTRMNPHQRIISLDRPLIKYNLDRSSLDSVYNFYEDSLKNAVKLGIKMKNAEEELMNSRQLLIDLVKIVQNTKSSTRVMNLNEISTKWPSLNWSAYFTSILSISSAAPIDNNDFITVDDLYINELIKLMNKSSPRVLTNYVLSHVVDESLIYLRIENITHLPSSRSELCLNLVAGLLPNTFDAVFAINYVESEKRDETIAMVANIKEQFKKIIEQSDWLNEQTKKKATEKLSSMTSMIGYLDEWKNNEWMELYYNDLELDGKNLLRCVLNINRFKMSFRYRTGRNHIDNEKRMIQMNRMPFYRAFENTIIISAGFLQHILSNNKLPKFMNYGRMGFFIGHEIIHSFDDVEELFKINKNLMQSTKNKFIGETSCMINQYSNYNVEEINSKLNGNTSVHENIADSSGVKLAYLAYTDWIKQNGSGDPTLFNLNYTPVQMFWINMAIPWCTKIHPEFLKNLINEKHSPAEFRIIGAVSNNENFSRDFDCPVGSKMNPMKKCTVW